ncbi:MAG: isochorismatase family protein [Spongiibacteraceae bacterium]
MKKQSLADADSFVQLEIHDALMIIDVQNDFLAGGSLSIPHGDEIIPTLNRYIDIFSHCRLPIIATRDWHPSDHGSFSKNGGVWPVHCVQHSPGAAFSKRLKLPKNTFIIDKGTVADDPGYSAFDQLQLWQILERQHCLRLFIGGLATDYCVLQTAAAACREGYDVVLLTDAMRAVDRHADDGAKALDQLRQLGAKEITLNDLHADDICA